MTESVEFNDEVYAIPLIYGDREIFILPEEEPYDFKGSHFNECLKKKNPVRVILGRFGKICRMSAPKINVVTEGSSPDEAWANFLAEVRKRNDADVLTFDIGPTTHDEIMDGLNISEDEDWSESIRE
ncbi:MAG: hypothetical protein ABSB91_06260 [Sedimentisphaerales bacterium]|jgi:hypothetical protein